MFFDHFLCTEYVNVHELEVLATAALSVSLRHFLILNEIEVNRQCQLRRGPFVSVSDCAFQDRSGWSILSDLDRTEVEAMEVSLLEALRERAIWTGDISVLVRAAVGLCACLCTDLDRAVAFGRALFFVDLLLVQPFWTITRPSLVAVAALALVLEAAGGTLNVLPTEVHTSVRMRI